jgi:hypothetical protein
MLPIFSYFSHDNQWVSQKKKNWSKYLLDKALSHGALPKSGP